MKWMTKVYCNEMFQDTTSKKIIPPKPQTAKDLKKITLNHSRDIAPVP